MIFQISNVIKRICAAKWNFLVLFSKVKITYVVSHMAEIGNPN